MKKDNTVFINNQTNTPNSNNDENMSGNNKEQLSICNLFQGTRMLFNINLAIGKNF